jgi:hypothetical protein
MKMYQHEAAGGSESGDGGKGYLHEMPFETRYKEQLYQSLKLRQDVCKL